MQKLTLIVSISFLLFFPGIGTAQEAILEPESWSFPAVIEHARKISPNNVEGKPFNEFGLAYSIDELERVRFSELLMSPN